MLFCFEFLGQFELFRLCRGKADTGWRDNSYEQSTNFSMDRLTKYNALLPGLAAMQASTVLNKQFAASKSTDFWLNQLSP